VLPIATARGRTLCFTTPSASSRPVAIGSTCAGFLKPSVRPLIFNYYTLRVLIKASGYNYAIALLASTWSSPSCRHKKPVELLEACSTREGDIINRFQVATFRCWLISIQQTEDPTTEKIRQLNFGHFNRRWNFCYPIVNFL
jgi:hypothetical protein